MNWRPLTISSVFVQLFHSILARRLSTTAYPFYDFQRAFRSVDGITSVFTFLSLLRSNRRRFKSFYVVSLDVSKAFDSVSNASLQRRDGALSFHPVMTRYLAHMYSGNSTNICWSGCRIDNVRMCRGVIA